MNQLRLRARMLLLAVSLAAFSIGVGYGYAQTGGGFDLSWSTIDAGGATSSTGGTFNLGGTVGQPDAGTHSGGTYSLQGGFWAGAAGPVCTLSPDYQTSTSSGASIVPGTSYVPGSTCNSCVVPVTLPFSYSFYGTPYSAVNVSNGGVVQFVSNNANGVNSCLPNANFIDAIFAYWDSHNTNINDAMGMYTSITGAAPNRIFNIEWRGGYEANDVRSAFEVRLYEGQPKFEVIYGNTRHGFSATVGVQKGTGERFTQYACNANGAIPTGLKITFDQLICQ